MGRFGAARARPPAPRGSPPDARGAGWGLISESATPRTEDDDDDDDEEERTGRRGWGYGRVLLVLILLVVVECFDDVVEDAGEEGEDPEVSIAHVGLRAGKPQHCHKIRGAEMAQSPLIWCMRAM
jgi:hypothetical protein